MKRFAHLMVTAAVLALGTLSLAACEFVDSAALPSVSGEPIGAQGKNKPAAPATATVKDLDVAQPDKPTGTLVGRQILSFRGDLSRLQTAIGQQTQKALQLRQDAQRNATSYQAAVASMNTKLQMGTTPGNPGMVEAWRQAQGNLQALSNDLDQMNALSNDVAKNSSFANYLLESIRATYSVSGAYEEDHRQLKILEDNTSQTQVTLDRLLGQMSADITHQTNYLAVERGNLTQLATAVNNGEFLGAPLANPAYAQQPYMTMSAQPMAAPMAAPGAGLATGRPLMVIRFDRQDVDYEQMLYKAANEALARKPNAGFDVVGVSPAAGTPAQLSLSSDQARNNAGKVARSLLNMGMPADRVSVTQVMDPNAQVNEVHLYIR